MGRTSGAAVHNRSVISRTLPPRAACGARQIVRATSEKSPKSTSQRVGILFALMTCVIIMKETSMRTDLVAIIWC